VLRSLKSRFATAVSIATVQGLSRQVALDIYAAVATWQAVVRSRSSTTPPLFRKLASTRRSR
jgi:hypothetical protein